MSQNILAALVDVQDAMWLVRAIRQAYGITCDIQFRGEHRVIVAPKLTNKQWPELAGFVRGFLMAAGIEQTIDQQ